MASYISAFIEGLKPDKPLTLSEWAAKYRVLSSKSSSLPGKWRNSVTPYLVTPMDTLSSDPYIQRVVLMFAAQLGKSECLANYVGMIIMMTPGPCMIVQPTQDMAKRFSVQRLQPLINETPELLERVGSNKSRDSSRTMFSVEFPNGLFIITSSSSSTGLRSMPARFCLCDEVDAYPADVGGKNGEGEGDPLSLAEKRTTTFGNRRKVLITSTPTVKGFSRVEKEYLLSDQRRFFVAAPCCGARQWLKWSQMEWDDDDPTTCRYRCESCGETFTEEHKHKMLAGGEWRATAEGDGKTAGFQLSGLYSPPGWLTWSDMVDEFLKAKHDQSMLRAWWNTRLGEPFEQLYSDRIDVESLLARRESYKAGELPEGALVVTLGVDVQGGGGSSSDALHYSVWAWGEGEECWLVDHQVLAGDPCRQEVWNQLDKVIDREWQHADGKKLKADIIACDSGGHATSEVYTWARARKSKGCIAIKGQSQRNKPPIGKPAHVDINFRGQSHKRGALCYPVGGDTIKTTLYARLRHSDPGPGCVHFHSEASEKYFLELTAETQQARFKKGFVIREWVKKPGSRNESTDTWVYAYAALQLFISKHDRSTFWDQMRARLEKIGQDPSKVSLKSKKGGKAAFVTNW